MSLFLPSIREIMVQIAGNARSKRLSLNLSQKTLAERSGVSLGVLKKFEREGKISLESLLKLSLVLDSLTDFQRLFKKADPEKFLSIDEFLRDDSRKRGRL